MIGIDKAFLLLGFSASLAAGAEETFDWGSLSPSTKLAFSPCFDQFQCARLILPRDWKNETRADTVTIAVIKLPADVSQDDPTFGGPIFTNPGGPGGSGVDFLRGGGTRMKSIIDIPGKKHYEYISFDPRGVGATEPRVDCYPANGMARRAKILEGVASGSLNLSPASFAYGHHTALGFGKRCEKENEDILPFVNTPSVARDMVAMVDKLDELRKEQTKKHEDSGAQLELRDASSSSGDVPRLQYIGFSYGTILGNYFASLFPERIGRVILDGVCDVNDYANGVGWLTNIQDAERMMEIFFEGCFEAGSQVCKLRQPSDKTPSDISKRTWDWIAARDSDPIDATTPDGSSDILLRSADIRGLLLQRLYTADFSFLSVANILAEALQNSYEPLASELLQLYTVSNLNDGCVIGNGTAPEKVASATSEPQSGVLCSDGDDVTDKNATFWKGYMGDQLAISPNFGESWSVIRLTCAAWRTRPNWSFKGPFKTPAASRDPSAPEPGKPAAPLLFLSTRYDPVTPLRNARAMASQHPGAGVLVTEAMGHSAIGHGRASDCTKKIVSEYFDKGIVPKKEVVCPGVKAPWDALSAQDVHVQELIRKRTKFDFLGI
ncbi:hypothetical protein PWT90_05947 [Aphanocladium album]|nr:hypothetical protein PWT90_05947 [Aphanocladium album]